VDESALVATNTIVANGNATSGTEAFGIFGENRFAGGAVATRGSEVRGLEELEQQKKGLATDQWYAGNKVTGQSVKGEGAVTTADGDHDASVRYREISQLGRGETSALDYGADVRAKDRVSGRRGSSTIVLPTDSPEIAGVPVQPSKPALPSVSLSLDSRMRAK
jgi:hypothetical protein